MNAEPILTLIAKTLHDCRLEVILVGNAAAALQGAPVTTLDFDFMFRDTPLNLKKLKKVAATLGMTISQPFHPASDLFRLIQAETGLQLDFMSRLHGIKSFESLKFRATHVRFGQDNLLVAELKDIIRSKRPLGRPKDKAVQKRLSMKKKNLKQTSRRAKLEALKSESERAELEQIRRLLALPMNKRTHFLRVRLPNGGSAL